MVNINLIQDSITINPTQWVLDEVELIKKKCYYKDIPVETKCIQAGIQVYLIFHRATVEIKIYNWQQILVDCLGPILEKDFIKVNELTFHVAGSVMEDLYGGRNL